MPTSPERQAGALTEEIEGDKLAGVVLDALRAADPNAYINDVCGDGLVVIDGEFELAAVAAYIRGRINGRENVRQAGAKEAIERDVGTLLAHWEAGDHLVSEAAHQIVGFVIGHERIQEAMRELERFGGDHHDLAAIVEYFGNRDL